jgi:hypothetical protein
MSGQMMDRILGITLPRERTLLCQRSRASGATVCGKRNLQQLITFDFLGIKLAFLGVKGWVNVTKISVPVDNL